MLDAGMLESSIVDVDRRSSTSTSTSTTSSMVQH
jgi:hypothetical protein